MALLTGCTGIPERTEPVKDFALDRYQGQWYEIARLDHSFERGLDCVTATYSLRERAAELDFPTDELIDVAQGETCPNR
ncbi:lipocalin family protein [Vreelandella sp. V005]|uniref:lipocalin family protein n=1 Tax=Vreelandella sp. V005 TaxID=3459608 RepID=UPI0040441F79